MWAHGSVYWGKIDTIYGLDSDYISMLELEAMAQKFGYALPVIFYCKEPKCNLDNGLVPITTNKDAYGMMELLHKDRITGLLWCIWNM